ncbi:ATP-binding protein [Nocardiopsis sp. NPDC006139]|uniref:ATP-binding protein n=1 Tax=Nocardiopsis sp. NPDC006139 TaxID=3154578 RepID=UPI00339FF97E
MKRAPIGRTWRHRVYKGHLARLTAVRRDLVRDLAGFDSDLTETLVLCGSELFANAVRYTASGERGGRVVRTLWTDGRGGVRLGFTDEGCGGTLPEIPKARGAEEWDRAEGQRGLLMVQELSTGWGYLSLCRWGDLGHHIRADFGPTRPARPACPGGTA